MNWIYRIIFNYFPGRDVGAAEWSMKPGVIGSPDPIKQTPRLLDGNQSGLDLRYGIALTTINGGMRDQPI